MYTVLYTVWYDTVYNKKLSESESQSTILYEISMVRQDDGPMFRVS